MKVYCAERKETVEEWSDATIQEVLHEESGNRLSSLKPYRYRVLFERYGTTQEVSAEEICIYEESEDLQGECQLCRRCVRLTKHHLIPKSTHRMMKKQRGLDSRYLSRTVDICRPCHSAVHRAEDNTSLALKYSTIEALLKHEKIQKWIRFAQKLNR
mmetsp:Transcript_28653/g.44870  ORF Transcript_28653/g.44870 Transcript_28653/m.44870 type:complete len:157 (+) Transcript_28653:464-934(+)